MIELLIKFDVIELLIQFAWVFILAVYILLVVLFFTKKTYEWMTKHGVRKKDAIYYNRKLVHIFAGGVVVLLVPIVFSYPLFPLFCGLALAGFTYFFHMRKGKMLYWFQTEENLNDVTFCIMWGLSIFVLWTILSLQGIENAAWIAIIPSTFMALGDGITGIVRNAAFRERSKHPIGNVYMAFLCIPFGYYLGLLGGGQQMAIVGIIAAFVASVVERYEIGPIDDNVLITLCSSVVLFIGSIIVI